MQLKTHRKSRASVHRLIAAAEPREAAGGLGNNAALRNVSGNKSATEKQQQHVSVESVQNLWCTAHKLNLTIVTREPICFVFFLPQKNTSLLCSALDRHNCKITNRQRLQSTCKISFWLFDKTQQFNDWGT